MEQPSEDNAGREPSADLEIEALRERFATIDEIDARTTEMFERITTVLRASAETRAQASLEIAAGLRRLEESLVVDRQRRIETMQALHADAERARQRMQEVLQAVASLGSQVAGLQARVSIPADATEEAEPSDAPPISPLDAVQSWTVVFDEVPSATLALALQHHLESLPAVVSVASVAFADGLLEFALRSRGALASASLIDWSGGTLEILDETPFGMRIRVVAAGKR